MTGRIPRSLTLALAGIGAAFCCLVAGMVAAGASELECRDLGSRIVQKGTAADVSQLNSFLFEAADKGCVELAESLLDRGASVLARRREGETALHHAARSGEVDVAAVLIARDADVEHRDLKGSTPLFLAVESNRRKIVDLLLKKGARTDNPGRSGVTPLAAAAFNGADAIVDLLVANGSDLNAQDATGKSAIVYAAARGFAGIVGRLLDAGVDVNRRYGNRLTALMWAAGYSNDVTEAEGVETVGLLIARGARLDDTDDRGRTALMMAAESDHAAVVAELLKAGADGALRDREGKTALDLAAGDAVRQALMKP